MAATYNRYTFSITLCEDARDSAVDVTAFFSNASEPKLLTLHAENDSGDAAVFTTVLDVALPQAISHAEYRVDGEMVAKSTPAATNASEAVNTDGPVRAVSTVVAEHTPAETACDDEDDSAIATPLSGIQGVPGPVAALKGLCQTGSASSSCLDLSLSDIKKVASVSKLTDRAADPATDGPIPDAAADPISDIAQPAPTDAAPEKPVSDDDTDYVVVTKEDTAELALADEPVGDDVAVVRAGESNAAEVVANDEPATEDVEAKDAAVPVNEAVVEEAVVQTEQENSSVVDA
ncbi:hypothetical protein LPJ58_005554, partial [Coemansia sp. RSA 1591]